MIYDFWSYPTKAREGFTLVKDPCAGKGQTSFNWRSLSVDSDNKTFLNRKLHLGQSIPVSPPPSSMGPPLLVITCQTIKKYYSKTRVDYPPVGTIFVSDKFKKIQL